MKCNAESFPKQRWPNQPTQLQLGFEIPDFATFCINSLNSADAQDKTRSSHLCTSQCWSSEALITRHFSNTASWSFNCKRSCFAVPWIYEVWFPTDLCFYHLHHRNPRLPQCPFWSTQPPHDSLCHVLSRVCDCCCQNPTYQLSRSALTSARTDAQSNGTNHLCFGNQTSPCLPPLPLRKINRDWMSLSLFTQECSVFGRLCF